MYVLEIRLRLNRIFFIKIINNINIFFMGRKYKTLQFSHFSASSVKLSRHSRLHYQQVSLASRPQHWNRENNTISRGGVNYEVDYERGRTHGRGSARSTSLCMQERSTGFLWERNLCIVLGSMKNTYLFEVRIHTCWIVNCIINLPASLKGIVMTSRKYILLLVEKI